MSEAPSSDKYPNYRSYAFVAALVVFVTALVLYCVTLAPTVTLVDSGELMLAAWGPGVAHPPGFPLYLMLAHIASLLPAGSVALRLNGFSALFGALAAAMLTLATYEAMAAIRSERKAAPEKFEIVAAVAAGLLFVFSRTIWAYSTVTEVYSLNTFLIATVLWLMLAWRRTTGDGDGYRLLYIAAFVFGLGLCVHHVTVAFLLPGLAVLVYTQTGGKFFLSKRLLFATLAAFAGLTLYLYLPIAASRSPLMNWGDVNSAERLWWHISGRQYQVFFDFSISRLGEFASLVNREFGRPWLLMGVAAALFGLVYLWQRARPYFWLYTLICASCLLYCMSYSIADDKDAYYLPAFACLSMAAGFGVLWLYELTGSTMLATFVAAALLLTACVSNYGYNDRSRYFVAHDYVENVLKSVPAGGMVITGDWQLYSPSLYTREIEGLRRDAIFIDVNLMRRSWYFGYLAKAYPEVYEPSRDKIAPLVADLRVFERDAAAANRNPVFLQRINQHFRDVIASVIRNQLNSGQLYLTLDVADPPNPDETGIKAMLNEGYDLAPQGLVFRANKKNSTAPPVEQPELNIRGLNDNSLRFDADDVVKRTVVPVYLMMLVNDGVYMSADGLRNAAVDRFRMALKIDPAYEPAKKALSASGSLR